MKLASAIDYFIHPVHFENSSKLRRARLLIRACWLTSLFSTSYIWMSIIFEYPLGIYLMMFNVVGFLLLPLLVKTRLPLPFTGNIYVAVGAVAVYLLTYYSGGVWSAIYAWIISVPILALLVVNKVSGAFWGFISLGVMVWMGMLAIQGVELPIQYNIAMRTEWYVSIFPGLLLMILFIAFVFEDIQAQALRVLQKKNEVLETQKKTISEQSTKLQKLIDEKENIIRILAHDLKNPLSNISSLTTFLNDEEGSEQQKMFVKMIQQSTNNAENLVHRVLEMDAAGQEDLQIQLQSIDTVGMLSNLVELMQQRANKKNIEIRFSNLAQKAVIDADEIYVSLIFENLISNAIKFSEEGKSVEATLSNDQNNLVITIKDEGPGVKKEEEDQLFKKFSKLSARPTGGESSAGIGLSLVKRYVEMMKGKVWYQPSDQTGAIFKVAFPLSQS
ncbi:sensor histidine kinase [Reichenbachiella ulvae]|uniref:histidine kinase n=1 Tax=Reichenbachiella ulvae TaxID=2980104 RepID=A0ABT3CS98_9BACT|nr:HAMP domain-containing sensor histidine kinase [Reichenbachiella ulvae]MCV9386519.1 HAMP domain-containing histidine kinase [Reichenbachiella ulvae]